MNEHESLAHGDAAWGRFRTQPEAAVPWRACRLPGKDSLKIPWMLHREIGVWVWWRIAKRKAIHQAANTIECLGDLLVLVIGW